MPSEFADLQVDLHDQRIDCTSPLGHDAYRTSRLGRLTIASTRTGPANLLQARIWERYGSQAKFADDIGVSTNTVSTWVGKLPPLRPHNARKLSVALDLDLDGLLEGKVVDARTTSTASASRKPASVASIVGVPERSPAEDVVRRLGEHEVQIEALRAVCPDLMAILADAIAVARQRRG